MPSLLHQGLPLLLVYLAHHVQETHEAGRLQSACLEGQMPVQPLWIDPENKKKPQIV